MIYPLDSVIQPLNNRGQVFTGPNKKLNRKQSKKGYVARSQTFWFLYESARARGLRGRAKIIIILFFASSAIALSIRPPSYQRSRIRALSTFVQLYANGHFGLNSK